MPAKSDFKAKGIICQNKKDWPGAINAFHKSLSLNPKDTETWFNLGLSFFNNKQYSEANNAYQKALSLDPQFTKVWIGLGLAFFYKNNIPRRLKLTARRLN